MCSVTCNNIFKDLEEPEIDETSKYDIITPTIVKPKRDYMNKSIDMMTDSVPELVNCLLLRGYCCLIEFPLCINFHITF